MRILYVADAASIHTRRWLEYFRDRGDEVHVASFRPYEMDGVTVHLLPKFGMGKLGYFLALRFLPKIYDAVKPDIVHAHYVTSYGFLAAFAGLHPLVVTAWGSDVLIAPRESRLLRFFARYAVTHADAVTTLADHMKTSVIELGCPANRITSTPFGVDSQFFVPAQHPVKNDAVLKLICTRNFDVVYDVGTLIRAIKEVVKAGGKVEVDLVGDGPMRQELTELVAEFGLGAFVRFHGHVSHATLAGLLANADIFISPALSDGNNVSLNEAMACGCFPIATDIPANAQWVKDGKNGYLYPPGNIEQLALSIQKAVSNIELRLSARLENRAIIETRVDWRICVRQMEAIYNGLMSADK